jgi:regulator of sirC expression with transglutaminase-like and TPR domain
VSTVPDPRAALLAELARSEEDVDLARAALLIAAEEYPDLDVDACLARIDGLADGVRGRLSGDEGPAGVLAAINGHLYRELGFRGNRAEYYDPRNSYLNDVIARRTGIPITLAVLYQAVAARLGHRLVGINLPMHFMLAWPLVDDALLVDPFEDGLIVTPRDCEARLTAIAGQPVRLQPEHFAAVDPRMIARRMLNNLYQIHRAQGDAARARAALERIGLVEALG